MSRKLLESADSVRWTIHVAGKVWTSHSRSTPLGLVGRFTCLMAIEFGTAPWLSNCGEISTSRRRMEGQDGSLSEIVALIHDHAAEGIILLYDSCLARDVEVE